MIRAVLFDLDETLIPEDEPLALCVSRRGARRRRRVPRPPAGALAARRAVSGGPGPGPGERERWIDRRVRRRRAGTHGDPLVPATVSRRSVRRRAARALAAHA